MWRLAPTHHFKYSKINQLGWSSRTLCRCAQMFLPYPQPLRTCASGFIAADHTLDHFTHRGFVMGNAAKKFACKAELDNAPRAGSEIRGSLVIWPEGSASRDDATYSPVASWIISARRSTSLTSSESPRRSIMPICNRRLNSRVTASRCVLTRLAISTCVALGRCTRSYRLGAPSSLVAKVQIVCEC